ncbi:MAG: glycogen synthase [Patescibacteria group bacterium]
MTSSLHIASIASEVAPYSKTGGLGDVAKALPKALANIGHMVSIITPYYSFIKQQGLPLEKLNVKSTVVVGRNKFPISYYAFDFSKNLRIYFVANEKLFTGRSKIYGHPDDNLRFCTFSIAALKLIELKRLKPDVIHCHDWQAGLIPNMMRFEGSKYPSLRNTASVFTIHNLTFQSGGDWWKLKKYYADDGKGNPLQRIGKLKYLNFSKRGILHADAINTVSERYAEEITTPEFGQGLEKYLSDRKDYLHGIINGIDYTVHNPAFDGNIEFKYDWNTLSRKKKNKLVLQKKLNLEKNPDIPVIGVVNRLTEQKGFKLIMETIDTLMRMNLQIAIVGSGFREYVIFFKKVARRYPKKLAIYTPFTEEMESKVYAGSDMFLMPSRFEPCGISQLKSLRYGSIPIVHETGGLSDTIMNYNPKTRKGNGFVFRQYARDAFLIALTRALENYKYTQAWEYLTWRGMQQSYSWELPAKKYVQLYGRAIKNKHDAQSKH